MLNPRLPHMNQTLRMQAGLFKKSNCPLLAKVLAPSNWLIAIRMASTVALWLSSRHNINSSVYSEINLQRIRK